MTIATTLKKNPFDKPVWVHWFGKDGHHAFLGKSDAQMAEEDKRIAEILERAKAEEVRK